MDTYNRFMPYLQQYHAMLVNDLNEPTSDTPSQTPGSASSTSSSGSSNGETPSQQQQSSGSSSSSSSSGESTPSTPGAAHALGPNVIVIGGGADNRRQRFFNNINDMMHLMAHLMHNISDLHVNIRDRPPRQMHTMSSMSNASAPHTTQTIIAAGTTTTTMPVEATIQIPIMAQIGPEGLNFQSGVPTASAATTTATSNQNTPGKYNLISLII